MEGIQTRVNLDYISDIVDEIALEGLDGITLPTLFERLKVRNNFAFYIDDDTKTFLWNAIRRINAVSFYLLPCDRRTLSVLDLQCNTDEEKLALAVLEDEIYPIKEVTAPNERGSCFYFNERKDITAEARCSELQTIMDKWSLRMVIVATLKHRFEAISVKEASPNPDEIFIQSTDFLYLEKIARARSRAMNFSGAGSLHSIGKDPRRIFYHVNNLIKHNLVIKHGQETVNGSTTTRVVLTRFKNDSVHLSVAERFLNRIVAELKSRKNKTMLYSELAKLFPEMNAKGRKKYVNLDSTKRKIHNNVMLPYRKVFPEAEPVEYMANNKEEKIVRCIQLKEEEVSDRKMDGPDDEDMAESTNGDMCLDLPLLNYAYRVILATGSRGISQVELSCKVGTTPQCVRTLIKKLLKDRIVKARILQVGRQRTQMFAVCEKELKKPVVKELQDRLLATSSIHNLPSTVVNTEGNNEQEAKDVSADIRPDNSRKALRISLILQALKNNRQLQRYDIQHLIEVEEEKRCLNGKMDRRSLLRILDQLITEGSIKMITINRNGTDVNYYAEPHCESVSSEPSPCESEKWLQKIIIECEREFSLLMSPEATTQDKDAKPVKTEQLYAPKFLRLSVLHDLLFYLVRGYTGDVEQSQEQLLAQVQSTCTLDDEIRAELPRLYSGHISCYTFIPPLSDAHQNIPGWCAVGDIILNAPFSLYAKIIKIPNLTTEMLQYLHHPVRSFYPIRSLPSSIRSDLQRSQPMSQLMQDLRRLCFMGLIRFGMRPRRKHFLNIVYVNLRASIKDTTSSPPRYLQIDNSIQYDVTKYFFQSKTAVKTYWVDLFNVCLETKLGVRDGAGDDVVVAREFQKDILLPAMKPILFELAAELDTGSLPGDGLGAGGLDSSLYSFLRSNWVGTAKSNKKAQVTSPKPLLKKLELKRKRITPVTKKKRFTKGKGKITYDEVDLEAIRMMRTLRVQWSQNEDNILLLSKAAIKYLCPNQRVSAKISWTEMRGVLRKHAPESRDKTQRAIARRLVFLLKMEEKTALVNSVAEVLKTCTEVEKYESSALVVLIKPTAPNLKELQEQLSQRFRDLVDFMVEKFIYQGLIISFQEKDIPDTLESMQQCFDMEKPVQPKLVLRKVNEDSIRAVLLSSLGSVSDKSSLATQLFEVYRQYDEALLHSAILRLHRQKVITLKKRLAQGQSVPVKLLPMRLSPYQFSRGFCFLMTTKYQQCVYHDAYVELNRLLCASTDQTIELNLSNCGPAVFVLASLGYVNLTTATPEQFIVLDSHLIPKEASSKIMKRYSELFETLNEKQSEGRSSSAQKAIKREPEEDLEVEPPKKRQLLCTETKETCPVGNRSESVETEITRALKRKREDDENDSALGFRSARLALYTLREIATTEMECIMVKKSVDLFVVSTSKVLCSPSDTLTRDFGLCTSRNSKKILSKISGRSEILRVIQDEAAVLDKLCPTLIPGMSKILPKIASFIASKGSMGVSSEDLKKEFDSEYLSECIKLLEENMLVLRLGLDEARFVAQKHASAWAVRSFKLTRLNREKIKPSELSLSDAATIKQVEESGSSALAEHSTPIQLIMRPWIRIEGSLNRKVVDRFLGTVLGQIMISPGISLQQLTSRFNSALTPSWTTELVEVLHDIGCIRRMVIITKKATLFSSGSSSFSDKITGLEHPSEIILEPEVDGIIKLGHFIGNKSYSKDFLS